MVIIAKQTLKYKASDMILKQKKPFSEEKGVLQNYHLRLRAASAFFLRFTLGFS